MKILITGGAGFVGSNIAIVLKEHFANSAIIALDNLHRKGSELNIPRLESNGVQFFNGDVRNPQDLDGVGAIDFLIECSAEPSVLAGSDGDTDYLIKTNLQGAINCADLCRKFNAPMIFLSTSRVYPIAPLLNCEIRTTETRFELTDTQLIPGLSSKGVSEAFPMDGARSLYGGTKYAAEVMLREFSDAFDFPVIINRCGVLAGPWQFGKADQGIAAFWTAAHIFGRSLKYIGFEGSGKQVRDILHIDDLIRLIVMQIKEPERFGVNEGEGNAVNGNQSSVIGGGRGAEGRTSNIERPTSNFESDTAKPACRAVAREGGWRDALVANPTRTGRAASGEQGREEENIQSPKINKNELTPLTISSHYSLPGGVWNVGGGLESSASLLELTSICQEITGNSIEITPESEMRYADIPIYITDTEKIETFCGWKPKKGIKDIIEDICKWIKETPGLSFEGTD